MKICDILYLIALAVVTFRYDICAEVDNKKICDIVTYITMIILIILALTVNILSYIL